MSRKIVYKKGDLLGKSTYRSAAMQDIMGKDQKKHVLNQKKEKKQLFRELKKHRQGGVTKEELKGVLAGLKYGSDDYFDVNEVNALAKELGLGTIKKKHLMSKSPSHNSKIDRANHDANYSHKNPSGKIRNTRRERDMPNDDIVHYELQRGMKKAFGSRYKKMVVDGNMMFEQEHEEMEFIDKGTGKKYFSKSSQLKRPDFHVRSQASLRGRGLIAGIKNL